MTMTTTALPASGRTMPSHVATSPARALIEIVIPVYNEAATLERSVRRVVGYVNETLPFRVRVTIADNASTDATAAIGVRLAAELDQVGYLRLQRKGRGLALRAAWERSTADVVAYMDVDLSTDLSALWPLVAPLLSGHSAVAIGTRLDRRSRVVRGPKREVISRCYNRLLRLVLRARFSDAQCGFKAVRRDVAARLLPAIEDEKWFFDTELLVLAERAGLRIHEVPVDWVDDPDSSVDITATALEDLRGVWRCLRAA
jgi:glycosyltransferase involved in cell wall biosynthesis